MKTTIGRVAVFTLAIWAAILIYKGMVVLVALWPEIFKPLTIAFGIAIALEVLLLSKKAEIEEEEKKQKAEKEPQ